VINNSQAPNYGLLLPPPPLGIYYIYVLWNAHKGCEGPTEKVGKIIISLNK
jgi:hypothetical protein